MQASWRMIGACEMKLFIRDHLDDVLIIGGSAAIVAATAQLSLIAAEFVGGVILIILGVLVGMGGRKP